MQSTKLTALSFSLALAFAASASAQTDMAPVSPPVGDSPVLIVGPAPQPVPDPAAAAKCQMVAPANYWDCVNSFHGGG